MHLDELVIESAVSTFEEVCNSLHVKLTGVELWSIVFGALVTCDSFLRTLRLNVVQFETTTRVEFLKEIKKVVWQDGSLLPGDTSCDGLQRYLEELLAAFGEAANDIYWQNGRWVQGKEFPDDDQFIRN